MLQDKPPPDLDEVWAQVEGALLPTFRTHSSSPLNQPALLHAPERWLEVYSAVYNVCSHHRQPRAAELYDRLRALLQRSAAEAARAMREIATTAAGGEV